MIHLLELDRCFSKIAAGVFSTAKEGDELGVKSLVVGLTVLFPQKEQEKQLEAQRVCSLAGPTNLKIQCFEVTVERIDEKQWYEFFNDMITSHPTLKTLTFVELEPRWLL